MFIGRGYGQEVESTPYSGEEHRSFEISRHPAAVVIQSDEAAVPPTIALSTGDTLILTWDEDGRTQDGRWFTFPVVLPATVRWVRPVAPSSGVLHRLYIPPAPWVESTVTGASSICDSPAWIPPSQWRAGLPPPAVPPVATPTHHVIVHHSASTLTDSNYLAVVRAIYLYHTQTRGWDDIGYNFVIDPAGVLYQARDPQGVADPDHIKGAHFCGKNSYTMGVCLLGNYQHTSPSPAALSTLIHLLTWKMHKEGLNPLDSMLHPVGSASAIWLPVIAPHRAGCATLCPGDSVAVRMSAIRQEVADSLQQCLPAAIRDEAIQEMPDRKMPFYYDLLGRRCAGDPPAGIFLRKYSGRQWQKEGRLRQRP